MSKKMKNEVLVEEEELGSESAKKSKQTIKYVRYLLLLIMVMVALIFLFLFRSQINGDNFRRLMAKINIGLSAPVAADGEVHFNASESVATTVYKDGFAYATVEKLIVTDKNGTEFQNTPLGFRNPVVTANSKYVMAYDRGGTGVLIADSFSILLEKQMDMPITMAKMNANGSFVVVTEGDGCLSKVYVFDSNFKEVYRYLSRNRYILDASLSKDGKAMAVSAMNIDGADIKPEVLYFKLNCEKIQWSVTFDDSPCVNISVKDNGNVCALFDWGMVALASDGSEKGRYMLNDQVLQSYSLDEGAVNVFIVSAAENGDGSIVVCDANGKVKHTVNMNFYAVRADYFDGRIAVLGNQRASVYDVSGKELWKGVPERANDIVLMDKNTVVIVSDTKCVYNSIK